MQRGASQTKRKIRHVKRVPLAPTHVDAGETLGRAQNHESSESEENEGNNKPASPVGAPPQLSAHQRSRLHELLQQRDAQGRAPYGLDNYAHMIGEPLGENNGGTFGNDEQ